MGVRMNQTEGCGLNGYGTCQFNEYKTGGYDSSSRKIEQIVYLEPNKYMIYFVEKEYLRPYYIDAYDFFAPFSEYFQKTLSEIKEINVKNEPQNEFIRQEIASAYYNALNGYDEVAIGELKTLKNKLLYRAYAWWFTTYIVLCGMITIICGILHAVCPYEEVKQLFYCLTASCVGSLLVHSRKEMTTGLATFLPGIAAYINFFSAVVSGFLVYCILKSNLILGDLGNSKYTMLMVCFVAGYSEDFPLKLIDKIGHIMGEAQGKRKKEISHEELHPFEKD